MKLVYLIFLLVSILSTYPIIILHGIGDACKFDGLTQLVHHLKTKLSVDVECIEIGNGFITSWFMNFSSQAEEACEKIKSNHRFQKKFNIFGISQGGLLGRYIIEKCDIQGEVVKYLSIDTPHMGIGVLPKIVCGFICEWINGLFYKVVYSDYIQANLGSPSFFKNPYDIQAYLNGSTFLADLNNEGPDKNETYKQKVKKLKGAMFVKNANDSVIIPRETAWFQFYDSTGVNLIKLEDSDFYKEDFIGLRYLVEKNRTQFIEWEGEHVSFTLDDVDKYLIDFLS
jgi:palmitoyl-protein thioesterase